MFRNAITKLSAAGSIRSLTTTSTLCREKAFSEVKLLGRVGRDPKAHGPSESKQIVVFNVAVNQLRRSVGSDESDVSEREVTYWHNVVVLRPAMQSYVLQHITKGTRVLCTGRLENRLVKRQSEEESEPVVMKLTNIVLEDIVLLARPQTNTSLEDKDEPVTDHADDFSHTLYFHVVIGITQIFKEPRGVIGTEMLRSVVNKLSTAAGSVRTLTTTSALCKERAFCEIRILGRVGRDPKEHGMDSKVVAFTVGVNRLVQSRMDSESFAEKEVTHWHNVVVFKPALQSYVMENITKGTRVLCNGRLETRIARRADDNENFTGYKLTNVVLEDIILLGRPQQLQLHDIDTLADNDSII